MRAYIACLASYNAGRLHGEWVDVSTDPDENAANIARVLRSSPYPNVTLTDPDTGETYASAEEYAVHDYDGPRSLSVMLGEYPSAQRLADAARLLEEIDARSGSGCDEPLAHAILEAMLDDGPPADLGALADGADDWISDHLAGVAESLEDWCADFMEETGGLEGIPEALRGYFDFKAYARDMVAGGDVFTVSMDGFSTSGGVAVFWNR